MDIVTGMAALTQAMDIGKRLFEVREELKSSELRLQIATMNNCLAEAQQALADAKRKLREQAEEITSLRRVRDLQAPMKRIGGYDFGINPDGINMRAFCPNCLLQGRQMQLIRGEKRTSKCPSCRANFPSGPTSISPEVALGINAELRQR